jgi:hypothetical protein
LLPVLNAESGRLKSSSREPVRFPCPSRMKPMTKKRPPGRPRLARGARRGRTIRVRVTQAEERQVYDAALAEGLSVSDFIRRRIGLAMAQPESAELT